MGVTLTSVAVLLCSLWLFARTNSAGLSFDASLPLTMKSRTWSRMLRGTVMPLPAKIHRPW